MTDPSPLQALAEVARALDQLGVRYLVCGSLASALHGEPRTSQDADLVADLLPHHATPLAERLAPAFYADADAIRLAAGQRSSCNVVHLASGWKIDLFVLRDRDYSRLEMQRAIPLQVEPGVTLRVATAEDTLVTKLEWFRKGGEVSERQWRDVLGILKTQADRLDLGHVRTWSERLGVADLLDRALRHSGIAG